MDGESPISSRRLKAYRVLVRIRPTVVGAWLKRFLRLKRVQIETNLRTFWIDPASLPGQKLLYTGIHEPCTIDVLKRLLSLESTCIDVGANERHLSVIASGLVGKCGRVVAVEPQHRLQHVCGPGMTSIAREERMMWGLDRAQLAAMGPRFDRQ